MAKDGTRKYRLVAAFAAMALLLGGCGQRTPLGEMTQEPTETVMQEEPIEVVKQWLDQDCSFTLSYQFSNFPIGGIAQNITQVFGADGGWSFISEQRTWNNTSAQEHQEKAEFYYRYEDGQLICYSGIDGETPQRAPVSDQVKDQMKNDKEYVYGKHAVLPDYMEAFFVARAEDTLVFTYELPLEKVLADGTMLQVFVNTVFVGVDKEYDPEWDVKILCTFEADGKTYQPQKLTYDFTQLKPHVMTEGALSGEYAFQQDFMTMGYTFDYNFPETTEIPAYMIP